jgi:hypothetical protein
MARFAILLVVLIAALGWGLSLVFETGPERNALLVSGVLVAAVQIVAFGVVQMAGRRNAALAGWGLGTVLRGIALVLYGLVFAKLFGLPLTAALVSFAVFLFASMLLEIFLISYAS